MRPRLPVAVVLLLLAALSGACSGGSPSATPEPPSTTEVPATTTTTRATTTTTSTTGVPRSTTTTTLIALGPGDAFISGTVTGPTGPVDGATVRIERLIGKAVATADVTSAGGSWRMDSVLGGSYRVRAFKPPDLGQGATEAFFLGATERKTVNFTLAKVEGDRITAVVDPNPPRVDQLATLTVQIGIGRVDDQGRATITPKPGIRVQLTVGPGHLIESAPVVVTDGNGAVAWRLRCVQQGATTVALMVGTGVTNVNLPPCGAPVATTPTPTLR